MGYLLSADIGGTKTLLCVTAAESGQVALHKSYASADYASFEQILELFLAEAGVRNIAAACLAVAGPVSGRRVQLTNLSWHIDADEIARRFAIGRVELINDFAAVCHGIDALNPADIMTLQAGRPSGGTRLVAGAGTGLGVGLIIQYNQIVTSEAGHMDFAPADDVQMQLLRYLQQRHGHVSYERIVSGPGLLAIYEFMRDSGLAAPSAELEQAMRVEDAPAVISRYAQRGDEKIAQMDMELFYAVYGAFVGNMALAVLPHGGIYIAGGIAAKNAAQLQASGFMQAFASKGRFAALLQQMPVQIVLNAEVGLLGAGLCARRMLEHRSLSL